MCMTDPRRWRRHSVAVKPAKAGLVYVAGVSGRFGRVIVGAGDGGGLLKEAGAKVFWEVIGDVDVWDFYGPGGLSAGEEE